jgi:hypothetical protein
MQMEIQLLELNKHLNRLPNELINIILSYNCNPQPIELRKDIISYYETKRILWEIYNFRYHGYPEYRKNADLYRFILRIINRDNENFYQKLFFAFIKRNYMLRNAKKIRIKQLMERINAQIITPFQINCFWGLWTPHERDLFISIQKQHPNHVV